MHDLTPAYCIETNFAFRSVAGHQSRGQNTTMITLIMMLIAASPGAPQAPIAAGPFSSMGEIVEAAHRCGIDSLRIESYSAPMLGEMRLFLDREIKTDAERCFDSWTTKNGKRLRLEPRWWKDDFSRDRP
jgi:hypothetical protein